MKKFQQLIIFPQSYPHKGGDQVFLKNELETIASNFNKIKIIHFKKFNDNKIETPSNVEVLYFDKIDPISNTFFLKHFATFQVFLSEFFRLSLYMFFKQFRFIAASSKVALTKISTLKENDLLDKHSLYYSFWMNDQAFMLALAKSKGLIGQFIFRLHGFDLYDEIRPSNYIPFRNFNFKHVLKAYTVSQFGFNYLIPKIKFPDKLTNNYLGTFEHGFNPIYIKEFVLVSCSSINISKRVTMIADSLEGIIDLKIKWIHIGDKGDWGTAEDLKVYCNKKLPTNITFESKGYLTNQALMKFYQTQPITAFIHLSETEGGPSIACVEAISFGIPLIATKVGGLREAVNSNTGIRLSENPSIEEIQNSIRKVVNIEYQSMDFRSGIQRFWKNKFEAKNNARKFINTLIKN